MSIIIMSIIVFFISYILSAILVISRIDNHIYCLPSMYYLLYSILVLSLSKSYLLSTTVLYILQYLLPAAILVLSPDRTLLRVSNARDRHTAWTAI